MAIKLPSRTGALAGTSQQPAQPRERVPRHNPIAQFIRECRVEFKKIVWPTRQEATRLTVIVIAVSVGTGLLLGGFDYGISQLFSLVAH